MSNASSNCIVLDANTPCGPEYAGYPIVSLASQRQNDISFFVSQARAMSDLTDLVNGPINFNNTGCNPAQAAQAISSVRYALSLWCSRAVTTAVTRGCSVPSGNLLPRGPYLCETECNAAATSLSAVFSNNALCPATTELSTSLRASVVEGIRTFCSLSKSSQASNNGQCSKGVSADQKTCGFASETIASTQCRNVSNDPCCTNLVGSARSNTTSNSGSTFSTGTSGANDTFAAGNTTNTRNGAQPSMKRSVVWCLFGLAALNIFSYSM